MVHLAASNGATGAARNKHKFNEEKWRRILQGAADTFAAKGYEAASIRDVAESVGMLGGSLYYYIKTKEDLLYALIDDFHRVGMEEVLMAEEEAIEAGYGDDPLALLRVVCVRHAEVNLRSRNLSAVFYNDFRYLSDERKNHIVESRHRHQYRMEELIALAQEAGEVSKDLSPRLTALAMLSLLNATNSWYQPEKDTSGQPIPKFLASLLIDGLAHTSLSTATGRPGAPTPAEPNSAPGKRTRSQTKKATKTAAGTSGELVSLKAASARRKR